MPLRSEPVTLAMGAAIAWLIELLVALLIVGRAAAASAADAAPVTASLDVVAPAACTTREEVVARIAARSSRIRLHPGPGGGEAAAFRVVIVPGSAGTVTGELTVVQSGRGRSLRKLIARSCADAADALALMVVVALDPSSLVAGDAATAGAIDKAAGTDAGATQTTPPSTTPRPSTSTPTSTETPPPPAMPPTPREPADTVVDAAEPAAEVPPGRARYGVGAFATVLFGPAPGAMPGFGVEASAALERESIWSPVLVLRGVHAWKDDVMAVGGTAAFALDALALDACPLRLRAAILEARVCGAGLAGRLSASGSNTYSPRADDRPFATLGGAAFLTLALGRYVALSSRFGLGASLVRDAFAFSPRQFHRVPAAVIEVDAGIGVRFP